MNNDIVLQNENGSKGLPSTAFQPEGKREEFLLVDPTGNREGIRQYAVHATLDLRNSDGVDYVGAAFLNVWSAGDCLVDGEERFGAHLEIVVADSDLTGIYFGSRWTSEDLSQLVRKEDLPAILQIF